MTVKLLDPIAVEDEAANVPPETNPTLQHGAVSHGVVTGCLVGFADNGVTPLVVYPGQQGTAAIAARATMDLHGAHVGREVVLVFEKADPFRPIVIGVLSGIPNGEPKLRSTSVEIEADGERLIVSANDQLVLRCGKAAITLTKAGKVLIAGEYVVSRSNGVNKLKGARVELN
jgi:Domain of unknown function (DUF6484)